MKLSPALLIPLLVSALLGSIGGSAFRWAGGEQAWNIFTAAFLWTLIAAAGTTIGRFAGERVRRGNWRRGIQLAAMQSVPLTAMFLAVAALVGATLTPPILLFFFGSTLLLAAVLAVLGVLSSPFIR